MGAGYVPDPTAYAAMLQAAGPGAGPAPVPALPAGWQGAGPEFAAMLAAAGAPPPAPAPAPVPKVAKRPAAPAGPVVVPGLPGQPEPPAASPIGPAAPDPQMASDAELTRIANTGAYAPGKLEDPGIPEPSKPAAAPQTLEQLGAPDTLQTIQADRAKEEKQAEETARLQGEQDKAKAQAEADAAHEEEALRIKHELELKQEQIAHQQQRMAQEGARDRAIAERQAFKFQDYWADKSTGNKVMAGIGLALGAIGGGLARTGNTVAEQLTKTMAADFDKQKARLELLSDNVAMARTGIMDADAAHKALREDMNLTQAAAIKSVEAKLTSQLKRLGVSQADIDANKTIQAIRAKYDEARRQMVLDQDKIDAEKAHRLIETQRAETDRIRANAAAKKAARVGHGGTGGKPKVTGEHLSEWSGKPATDGERDADTFAEREVTQLNIVRSRAPMPEKDRQTIRSYLAEAIVAEKNPGADWAAKLFQKRSSLEERLTPQGRELWQAYKEFIAANLRKESGAAISVSEEQQAFNRFAPAPGDTAANIRRKTDAMKGVAKNNVERSYRPSYWRPQLDGGAAPATPAAGAGAGKAPAGKPAAAAARRVRLKDGRTGSLSPDGTFTPDG